MNFLTDSVLNQKEFYCSILKRSRCDKLQEYSIKSGDFHLNVKVDFESFFILTFEDKYRRSHLLKRYNFCMKHFFLKFLFSRYFINPEFFCHPVCKYACYIVCHIILQHKCLEISCYDDCENNMFCKICYVHILL